MPNKRLDLVGQKFNMMTVLESAGVDSRNQSLFRCTCDCGTEKIVMGRLLRSGDTKSCGCLRVIEGRKAGLKSVVHGLINTPTYRTWQGMKARCLDSTNINYKWYGAKGVSICDAWLTFEGFLNDMGERPEGMTLDRINPFGSYEPSNCRWADSETQRMNTRKRYMEASCQQ
jgi:hypothetical protein